MKNPLFVAAVAVVAVLSAASASAQTQPPRPTQPPGQQTTPPVKPTPAKILADGKAAFEKGDIDEAHAILKPLGDENNLEAAYWLGETLLVGGKRLKKDEKLAVGWFNKAAEGGHVDAMFKLGRMYFSGEGAERDETRGVALFRQAADKGHRDSTVLMGVMYVNGTVVPKSDKDARDWFEKAIRLGSVQAMIFLSDNLVTSTEIPHDYRRAYMWLEVARAKGHPQANAKILNLIPSMNGSEIRSAKEWAQAYLDKGTWPPKI
ncbi:MAG: tetratricopeptide repeat protein [Alphaproteobacteria bacterium]